MYLLDELHHKTAVIDLSIHGETHEQCHFSHQKSFLPQMWQFDNMGIELCARL